MHRDAVEYHHGEKRWWERCHECITYQKRVLWCCAADKPSGSGWDWFDVLAVNLTQRECCLSPPCFPCLNISYPLHQNQQCKNQSVTQEDMRASAYRQTDQLELRVGIENGGKEMTVEVKEWQRKEGQWLLKDSWGMIAEVGEEFMWKGRKRKWDAQWANSHSGLDIGSKEELSEDAIIQGEICENTTVPTIL